MHRYTEALERLVHSSDLFVPDFLTPAVARGTIPTNYKYINIGKSDQIALATKGAEYAFKYFGASPTYHDKCRPFFTQAMLIGASLENAYRGIYVITPWQYGKSYTASEIALIKMLQDERVLIAAASMPLSDIIMSETREHIQHLPKTLQSTLTKKGLSDVERLVTSTSKLTLSKKGGGRLEQITLGSTFRKSLLYNKGVGRGWCYVIDEAGILTGEVLGETARNEFSSLTSDSKLMFQISNPHFRGEFMNHMFSPGEKDLVVWCDIRTAIEEGRWESADYILSTSAAEDEHLTKKYLLCDIEDEDSVGFFPVPETADFPLPQDTPVWVGIDSADKGKDKIYVTLLCAHENKHHFIGSVEIKKPAEWHVGKTRTVIATRIIEILKPFNTQFIAVDIGGGGGYISDALAQAGFRVKEIMFGSGTTKKRHDTKASNRPAVTGSNLRAEMHLDLRYIMEHKVCTFSTACAELIRDELACVRTTVNASGKTQIVDKQELKIYLGHSPDALDSVLLALRARIEQNLMYI